MAKNPLVVVVFALALSVLSGLTIVACGSEQSELVFQMVAQDGSGQAGRAKPELSRWRPTAPARRSW